MDEAAWQNETTAVWVLFRCWSRAIHQQRSVGSNGFHFFRDPDRKLRLLAIAACQPLKELIQHEWHRFALEVTDETADHLDLNHETKTAGALRELSNDLGHPSHAYNRHIDFAIWSAAIPHEFWEATESVIFDVVRALVSAGVADRDQLEARHRALIRDIVGNPFRPVAFNPEWRGEHAVGIALRMYNDRDFRAMPILADALEEAGCEHPDILTHCREPGEHVRGCWVVDLVLGK